MMNFQSVALAVEAETSAWRAAEATFEKHLERVYGKRDAAIARYQLHHEDEAVREAREAFVRASDTWRNAVRTARQGLVARNPSHG